MPRPLLPRAVLQCLCAALTGLLIATVLRASPAFADEIKVFAAASLKEALEEVAKQYARLPDRPRIIHSFAASSALAKQVENGAPADLFISADEDWMNYLAQRKLIDAATRVDLLRNQLVLIAPADSKAQVSVGRGFPLASLLGDGRLAVADPDHVPAGKYAKATLEYLDVWGHVERRLARAENVRAALALVSRGEALFGIVYATDARADPKVRVVGTFPAGSHAPIVYPAAVTAASVHASARSFLDYLTTRDAWSVFAAHGFLPPR